MAWAAFEWTEWHLTPRGWEAGSYFNGTHEIERVAPEDRVQTRRCTEVKTGRTVSALWEVKWELAERSVVDELIEKYGKDDRMRRG